MKAISLKQKQSRRQFGFSLIELLIVIAIILIILAIALPKLNTARRYAQEMAAISTLRTLHSAEAQFYSQYGKFAATLDELGPPASGAPTAAASDLIPGDLAKGEKGGYKYSLSVSPSGGYIINANPVIFNTSGSRTFFSDQSMTVHENRGPEPATATSPEIK